MIKIGDIYTGTINANVSGSAYLVSNDLPKDIYIYINKKNVNKAFHMDTIKIKIINGDGRALEGEVIEIVQRFKTEFVGVIQVSPRYAFFVPDSNKISVDFYVPLDKILDAKDGQKVIARITKWKDDAKNPNAEIIRIIGDAGEHETEIHSILEAHSLPYKFDNEVLAESEVISDEITESEIDKRRDLRDVLTFTIDGETARDLDDALSIQWVNGNIEVGIHIADVSYYVRPKTEIDKEAYARGTSVYLCDRCIPMLPERLSNNLCSLNPNTDKLVFSFMFTLDQNGTVINESFSRGIINSNYRLTYTEVQKVIEGGETYSNELKIGLLELNKYANKLRKRREKRDSLSFNGVEIKFKLDENNKPIDVYFTQQNEANFLIEEFMVLTNMRVCEFITKSNTPTIHRTHDKPDQIKLIALKSFVERMGYKLDLSDDSKIKEELNKLLLEVKGTAEENIVNSLVVRCMAKAIYQTTNIGHYGLGLKFYTHVTSPIRRFCDLQIHRILTLILPNKGYIGN